MAISNFGIGSFDNADSSFQGLGNLVSISTLGSLEGCTDNTMFNYNPNANTDCTDVQGTTNGTAQDNSGVYTCCEPVIPGCTDPNASNFDSGANTLDNSCYWLGCTDPAYVEFNPIATVDDGSCATLITYGCTDTSQSLINDGTTNLYPDYINAGSFINPCDGANGPPCFGGQTGLNCCCEPTIVGCTDATQFNYDPNANYQPVTGSNLECVPVLLGCMDVLALNFDCASSINPGSNTPCSDGVNTSDGSCTYALSGCTHPDAINYYGPSPGMTDDGSCGFSGCNPLAFSLTNATLNNASPLMGTTYIANGWTYYLAPQAFPTIANAFVNQDNSCTFTGCEDPTANNFDVEVQNYITTYNLTTSIITPDGSCTYAIYGCTDATACNYDITATIDDGSCILPDGCTDPTACNYDASALCDDGSCLFGTSGCTNPNAVNYDPTAVCDDGTCSGLLGCITYTYATNYNCLPGNTPAAGSNDCGDGITQDDGSCLFTGCGYLENSFYSNTGVIGFETSPGVTAQPDAAAMDYYLGHGIALNEGASCINNLTPGYESQYCLTEHWYALGQASPPVYPGAPNNTIELGVNFTDDGSCVFRGCFDVNACNYAPATGWENNPPTNHPSWPGQGYTNDNAYCDYTSCAGSYSIGDYYEGGILFYFNNGVDVTGGGLVISDVDLIAGPNMASEWGYLGVTTGATGTAIGTGLANTNSILTNNIDPNTNLVAYNGMINGLPIAAKLASDYNGNGYNDWYLPSEDELEQFKASGANSASGNYTNAVVLDCCNKWYWTSTEANTNNAIIVHGGSNASLTINKIGTHHVHAIRAF